MCLHQCCHLLKSPPPPKSCQGMDFKRNYCVYITVATYLSTPPPNHVKEWTTRGIIVCLHQCCHLLKHPLHKSCQGMDNKRNYCVYISFATYLSPPPPQIMSRNGRQEELLCVYISVATYLSPPPPPNHVKEWTSRGIIVFTSPLPPT